MTNTIRLLDDSQSPFDRIRRVDPDGSEWWSARDLMPLMGYDQWRRFAGAVERARVSAEAQGQIVENHFAAAGKMVKIGSSATREAADYRLTRFACYLVAMSGDPRKPEVAAAQAYFAVRTREAAESQATLFDRPSHLFPGIVNKGFNADCQVESTSVDHGYRDVSLAAKIAAEGDVFDSGVAGQLGYGFSLKAGLRANHGTEGGVESLCCSNVVGCHGYNATTAAQYQSRLVPDYSLTGLTR